MTKITTSQTVGPFSHEAWQWAATATRNAELKTTAATITVRGAIYDGDGAPINDAQIEAWLPQGAAYEQQQAIPGFRRQPSGEAGEFEFRISRPAQPAPGEPAAYITVFARGLGKHQFTAVFLGDDAGLPASAILEQVPAARRATLVAAAQPDGSYVWNIHMQGGQETVFFDYQ
jgi:protocatechuate 3,4-dioxygenase alpha subunit